MKRIILFVSLLFGVTTSVYADTCSTGLMPLFTAPQAAKLCSYFSAGTIGTIANNTYVTARNAAGTDNLNIWKADSSDNTILNAGSGKTVKVTIADTPVAQISSGILNLTGNLINSTAGTGQIMVPYVVTMAATPAAGTNDIKVGINIVPTAAANTAALLASTPTPGAVSNIYNSNGTNSVRIKAGGASTMNGATAGGYFALAAKTSARCYADTSGSNYVCELAANPTPAGP